jgi:hypothetical protein
VPQKCGRFRDAIKLSGLNRDFIYDLIKQGLIKSFVVKSRPGNQTGVRLIDLQSLSDYLDKLAAESSGLEKAKPGRPRKEVRNA